MGGGWHQPVACLALSEQKLLRERRTRTCVSPIGCCVYGTTPAATNYTYAEYGTTSPVSCVPSPPSDTPPAPQRSRHNFFRSSTRKRGVRERDSRDGWFWFFGSLGRDTNTLTFVDGAKPVEERAWSKRPISPHRAQNKRKSHPIEKANGYQQSTEVEQKTNQRSVKSQSHTHNRPVEQQQGGDTEKSTETSMNTCLRLSRTQTDLHNQPPQTNRGY